MSEIQNISATVYNDELFEHLFKAHYKALHAYASAMLKDIDLAEEIVQQMFLRFWEKRELLSITTSIKAYLYKSVHNDSLNYLKHENVKMKYQNFIFHRGDGFSEPASAKAELSELENKLDSALKELPEQCRTIFQMSRFEELKYREISDQLGLPIKTVENQMGKALKILRLKLVDFLILVALGVISFRDFLS